MDPTTRVAEVAASRGALWLAEAFNLFRRKPMAWIGMCMGWIIITFGLILVPFIGGVIANFLQPVFFATNRDRVLAPSMRVLSAVVAALQDPSEASTAYATKRLATITLSLLATTAVHADDVRVDETIAAPAARAS